MTVSHGLTSVVTDLICNPPTVVIPSWGRGEGGTFFRRKMAATGILRVTITFGAVERGMTHGLYTAVAYPPVLFM